MNKFRKSDGKDSSPDQNTDGRNLGLSFPCISSLPPIPFVGLSKKSFIVVVVYNRVQMMISHSDSNQPNQ